MTDSPIRVVGLGGSADVPSASLSALRLALAGAEAFGATTTLLDLGQLDLPMFDDVANRSPAIDQVVQAHRQADAVIWATPLYHGAPSGRFKNAVDWLELLSGDERPYLTDVPVGLVATSGGTQALQAINGMENIVRALRGITVPLTAPVMRGWSAFEDDGTAKDPATDKMLSGLGAEVVRLARRLKVSPS